VTELFDWAITCAEEAVLALGTVRDLSAGSNLRLHNLGAHRLKGMPEDTEVFQVTMAIA
jgi:class 3 adenylate cyclase